MPQLLPRHAPRRCPALLATAAAATAAGAFGLPLASAQTLPRVVYTTFDPATSTVDVPGVGTRTLSGWNGLFRSPNGQRWIAVANLTGDSTTNRVIIAGSGTTAAGAQVVVRKGGAIPGSPRTFNIIDNPRINDAGQYAFSTNSSGASGTTPTVFYLTGAVGSPTHTVQAAIGQPVSFIPGSTYSGGFFGTLLDNTGRFGFVSIINNGTTTDEAVIFDNAVIAREADPATAPDTLPAAPSGNWQTFVQRRAFIDAAGENFFWLGAIASPTSISGVDAVALNNTAVVQEDAGLPDQTTELVEGIFSVWYEPGGDWFLRSTFADESTTDTDNTDFVLRNGAIVARRGDPIVPGSSIVWDRASATSTSQGFLFHVGNDRGDYVVAGNTRNVADDTRGAAVVLNGDTVVISRGDRIDVDGNGLPNDDAFLLGLKSEIGPGTAFLTDQGELWLVVDVRNGAAADIGDAIIRITLDIAACAADFDASGAVDVSDIFAFLSAWFSNAPGSDFDNSGATDVSDIFAFLSAWFAGC